MLYRDYGTKWLDEISYERNVIDPSSVISSIIAKLYTSYPASLSFSAGLESLFDSDADTGNLGIRLIADVN